MLPSRGLSRVHAASVLRQCATNPSKAPRSLPFSRQLSSSTTSRSKTATVLSQRATRPTIASSSGFIAHGGPSVGVFANRSGASRNISLWPSSMWPFGGGSSKNPQQQQAATENSTTLGQEDAAATTTTSSTAQAAPQAPSSPDAVDTLIENGGAAAAEPSAKNWSDLELDVPSILDMPETIGFLKNMGLDFGWGPTSMCEYFLEHIYVYTGLPWWATIAATAFAFRAIIFVPTLKGSWHTSKLAELHKSPEFQAAMELQKQALANKDQAALLQSRTTQQKLKNKSGAKLSMTMIPFLMFPFSLGMFRLLRNMATMGVPSLETGGLAWFSDLSASDPYYILPLVNMAISVVVFKQMQATNAAPSEAARAMQNMFQYVLPPLIFVSTCWLPATVQWFFFNLTIGTWIQSSAAKNPAIRRAFDLPLLQSPAQKAAAAAAAAGGAPSYQPPKPRGMAAIRENVDAISKSTNEYMGTDPQAMQRKKAEEYEQRRAAEERERIERKKMRSSRRRN